MQLYPSTLPPRNENVSDRDYPGQFRAPSLAQILTLVFISYAVFLVFLRLTGTAYWPMVEYKTGDNPSYLLAAFAIRHWQFTGVEVKQFWGLPYAVAAVSVVTRVSLPAALAGVSVTASVVSVILCYSLWGGWIAAYFALLNFDWFQRSLLGGAESLFVALVLGSFFLLRRNRWWEAATVGALATVVRPFGVFALIGLGVSLLLQKRFRDCVVATLIALAIGGLYMWPLQHYLGNPLHNVARYQTNDWHGHSPFNFPFVAIFHDTFPISSPLTNLALTLGWIAFVLLAVGVGVGSGKLQQYAAGHVAETGFFGLYCLALYTYQAPGWSRAEFPRFVIPILPWVFFLLYRYLPKDLRVLWILAFVTPSLAAASAIGIKQTWSIFLQHFH